MDKGARRLSCATYEFDAGQDLPSLVKLLVKNRARAVNVITGHVLSSMEESRVMLSCK